MKLKGIIKLFSVTLMSLCWCYSRGDSLLLEEVDMTVYCSTEDVSQETSGNVHINDDEESDDDVPGNSDIGDGGIEEDKEDEEKDSMAGISGTLPILYIEVRDADGNHDNEIIDRNLQHKEYFEGQYWVEIPDGLSMLFPSLGSAEDPLELKIKARGNFTRTGFSKKPFKIKLDKKQNLLGLSHAKSKHYALLAHADDPYGYLRNFTAFHIGQMLGLPWTPGMTPVELVINGDYRGLYFLTESIRVEEGRVEIEKLDDFCEVVSLVSGGYLVEIDNYGSPDQLVFKTHREPNIPFQPLRISFESPEHYSPLQMMFVRDQFEKMNELIELGSDETWAYLDLDDAVRYYLVCEITGHLEAFHGSTFLYRDRGLHEKWHLAPLWDFGRAFDCKKREFFYSETSPYGYTWWVPDFRRNERFNEHLSKIWRWFVRNRLDMIYPLISDYVNYISQAAVCDARRWRDELLPESVDHKTVRPVADNSNIFEKGTKVKDYLSKRVEWLKGFFGEVDPYLSYDLPDHDDTPAAVLPDFLSGLSEPACPVEDYPAVLYNLSGIRIDNPQKGEIYIVVTPAGSRKILY